MKTKISVHEMIEALGEMHQEVQQRCRRHQVLVELLRSWEIPAGEGVLLLLDSALSIAVSSKREDSTIEELVETLRGSVEARLKTLAAAYREFSEMEKAAAGGASGAGKAGGAGKTGGDADGGVVVPPGGVN